MVILVSIQTLWINIKYVPLWIKYTHGSNVKYVDIHMCVEAFHLMEVNVGTFDVSLIALSFPVVASSLFPWWAQTRVNSFIHQGICLVIDFALCYGPNMLTSNVPCFMSKGLNSHLLYFHEIISSQCYVEYRNFSTTV